MQYKYGIIGAGQMGGAIIRGMLAAGACAPGELLVVDKDAALVRRLKDKLGVSATDAYDRELSECAAIVVVVKPAIVSRALQDLLYYLSDDQLIISGAAGWSIKQLQRSLGRPARIVRAMPNMPAQLGWGMTALCASEMASDSDREAATRLFEAIGLVEWVSDAQMDAVTAVSGGGPAYAFMFIEAMADGAVKQGLPRDAAYRLVAQTLLGAAHMVLESGQHPAALKDAVCSPAGTTIEAVAHLEASGFRGAVIEAIDKAAARSRALNP